jgi:glycosyltransferase involved in cell wall biosynthesis
VEKLLQNKRICLITIQYYPSWGGVARSATRLVKYLREQGAEVDVVVPLSIDKKKSEGDVRPMHLTEICENWSSDENNARVFTIPIYSNEQQMSKLIEFIQLLDYQNRYSLFHGFWLPFAYPALIVSSRLDVPVIASIRGNDAVEWVGLPAYLPFIQAVLYKADWVTSVCTDLLSNVNSIENIAGRSSVILNGIDSTGFPLWRYEDCKLGSVGYAGELRYKKGITFLIEAFADLEIPDKQLRLIGTYKTETEKEHIFSKMHQLGIDQLCVHTGRLERNNLLNEVSRLNVFVISSLHDGLPNGLLEAAACGVPIVATNVAGMADVLEHGENCLLVEPGNIFALSKAISKLLTDEALCKKLSLGAIKLAKLLDENQEKNSWLDLYTKLIDKKPGRFELISKKLANNILDVEKICV